ncbi:endonuclease G [Mesorhizobium albiziae]|uniref:Serine protease n=1 Tax=Neomesorhizobium albiziae TaxID=335020 RepID=A0A1I3ZIX2_9HYPH|nr:DNA/RNA non-specific endonuclease [Mesorhizobium albiziae]GLS32214.1 serine protease [Mesorhizobium albiziae]SFK43997.1 endonuclease G [Mesorhizobium albiziae]
MVDIRTYAEVENVVRQRLAKTRPEIETSLGHIARGNPLASEPSPIRRVNRLQAKADLSRDEAQIIAAAIDMASAKDSKAEAAKAAGPEAILGSTLDFVGIAFLERGRRAADAVGRVAFRKERPQGSGFLVGPRLFLTNHHVISTPADAARFQVQFDYEYDRFNRPRASTDFVFDPDFCFVSDGIEGLDYTLIGLGERRAGARQLDEFGFISLSDAGDKHMLGEIANVIQHPDGRFKEVVLRENHLVARDETLQVLHYVADTEQGSSGSPVFNNEWEPIALHHWAGPWREVMGKDGQPLSREINEGIRISAIVRDLRDRVAGLKGSTRTMVVKALALWEETARSMGEAAAPVTPAAGGNAAPNARIAEEPATPGARTNADGSVTWTFPIEISVRAPLASLPAIIESEPLATIAPKGGGVGRAEAAKWQKEDFSDRGGYEPGFIPGFVLPLPNHDAAPGRAARNLLANAGNDQFELRYHHFSIVMNADRRLAYFTACNIDGSRTKAINREDKTVIDDPTLKDLGVESIGAEGAEASDDFSPDRRIDLNEQIYRPFYEKQKVPGFPDAQSKERIARMFQKGHIIMRGDPAWGTSDEALAAEHDTFFYTNAAPQVGFFNQGSALNRPGSKGKLRWRAVETYVLRNAVTMRGRITVFAGPVFREDDPPYRFDSRIPLKFWKIAAWSDGSNLRSIGLVADQKPVLEVMPEGFDSQAEAFDDPLELARVSEFLSTVAEIEQLTGLDFGTALREADIRAGSEAVGVAAQTLKPEALSVALKLPKTADGRRASKRRKKSPG